MKIENREEKKKDREKGSGFGSLEYIHLPVKRSHHSIHRLAEHISQNSSRLWSCRCCMTSTTPGVGSPIDAVIGPANMSVPSERCPFFTESEAASNVLLSTSDRHEFDLCPAGQSFFFPFSEKPRVTGEHRPYFVEVHYLSTRHSQMKNLSPFILFLNLIHWKDQVAVFK